MKMKDSGVEWIGEIPIEWKNAKLKDLSIVYTGNSIKNDEKDKYIYKENTYPYISTKDINLWNQKIDYSDILFIPKENETFKVAKKDSTLICIEGGSAGLKKTFLENDVTFVNKLCCIQPKSIHAKYLFYILVSKGFESEFEKNLTGLIPGLSVETLKNISIPVADIFNEQEQIAHFLDEKVSKIDAIIADTKESIEALKAYKQSVITETVTKGLNPNAPMKDSGVEWIGEVPEEWKILKLRYLGSLQNGISKTGEYFGTGYPFVSYGDIYNHSIIKPTGLVNSSKADRKNYSILRGDVLFTRTSETIDEIGFSSVSLEDVRDAVFSGFLIRFRPYNSIILPEFSKYYFRSQHVRKYFTGKMNMVIRASLGQNLLKSLPVSIPNKEEQQEIAEFLDGMTGSLENLIQEKEHLITEYESYKKSLIYEYVTGKKRVGGEESAG